MTDYSQMTEEELATALDEAVAAQYEARRREILRDLPQWIATNLLQVDSYQGNQVEVILAAMNMPYRVLEPMTEGPEGDIPIIDDDQAAEVIAGLQARLAQ